MVCVRDKGFLVAPTITSPLQAVLLSSVLRIQETKDPDRDKTIVTIKRRGAKRKGGKERERIREIVFLLRFKERQGKKRRHAISRRRCLTAAKSRATRGDVHKPPFIVHPFERSETSTKLVPRFIANIQKEMPTRDFASLKIATSNHVIVSKTSLKGRRGTGWRGGR